MPCRHAPVIAEVGNQLHVTCACGLDYYVPKLLTHPTSPQPPSTPCGGG